MIQFHLRFLATIFESEFEKIFSKQFKEPRSYMKIMVVLKKQAMNLNEISQASKISSGGTLKRYLDILELADFVSSYFSINKGSKSKDKIEQKGLKNLFRKITMLSWPGYFELAFERFDNIISIFEIKSSPFIDESVIRDFENKITKLGHILI